MKVLKRNEEYIGVWYIPKDDKNQLTGTLSISDEGKVSLFIPYGFNGLGNFESIGIINGVISTGRGVTLVDCMCTSSNISMPGFQTCEYTCAYAIIGNTYESIGEVRFKSIKTKYDYFNLWLNMSPYVIEKPIESGKKEIDMHYKMPDIIMSGYGEDRIQFENEVKFDYDGYSRFDIKQQEWVKFIFSKDKGYADAVEVLGEFAQFLTLCMSRRIGCDYIITEDIYDKEVEVIVQMSRKEDTKKLREQDICIKYTFIRENFDTCIEEWVKKKELLDPIIGYFVEAHDREFHIPMSFLKVIQALEAFSRRMRNNQELPEEDFKKMVERIVSQIEEDDDKQLITSILSNEPRLRKRLTDLFVEVNDIFNISSKKRKSLVAHVVDTRNYYTHFDSSLKDKILGSSEIYYTTQFFKIVLKVILLKELGIDPELIKHRISNDQEWLFLKRQLGWM